MYLEHFGLKEEPFAVTSDPRYLYLSQSHEEAISHLMYCVTYRKGFAAITGEVGTGKTTLLNAFLTRLGPQYTVAFVYQSASTTLELLGFIFKDLGLSTPQGGKAEWMAVFNQFLLAQHAQARECVLVVDEAQNLSVDVLEDLRLISNFETPTQKLVQIVLAGQNELAAMLRQPELRQLNQRIFIQYQMRPLGAEETGRYVQHRLNVAGANRVDVFKASALKQIHVYSGGIPRLVNQICDVALLRAAHQREQVIGPTLIKKVQREDLHHRGGDYLKGLPSSDSEGKTPWFMRVKRWLLPMAFLLAGLGGGIGLRHLYEAAPPMAVDLPRDVVDSQGPVLQAKSEPEAVATTPAGVSEPISSDGEAQDPATTPVKASARTDSGSHIPPHTARIRGEYSVRGVLAGDRLSSLVRENYGFSTWELMVEVVKANPAITNPNHIIAGANIVMPALSDSVLQRVRRGKPL